MITLEQLTDIIAKGERIDVEFKSDRRTMPDREIYEEVISLANSKCGVLLIGVEDDGFYERYRRSHINYYPI